MFFSKRNKSRQGEVKVKTSAKYKLQCSSFSTQEMEHFGEWSGGRHEVTNLVFKCAENNNN